MDGSRDLIEEISRLKRELDETKVLQVVEGEKKKRESAEEENQRLRREVEERRIHAAVGEEARRRERVEAEVARMQCKLEDSKEELRKQAEELEKTREELKATGSDENKRIRRELAERRAKMGHMEQTIVAFIASKERYATRERWMKQYGFQGRVLMHDVATAVKICAAWKASVFFDKMLRKELHLRSNTKDAMRAMRANVIEGTSSRELWQIGEYCWTQWLILLESGRAEKRVNRAEEQAALCRKRMAPALLKCVDKNGQEYLDEIFTYWQSCVREARAQSKFADFRERMAEAQEQARVALLEKDKFLEMGTQASHVLGAAIKQLRRANEAEAAAAMSSAWGGWRQVVADTKKAKEVAEEQNRARILAASARCQAIELAMRGMGAALIGTASQAWKEEVALTKKARLIKKQGMARGMRAIAGSQQAIKELVYSTWNRATVEGRGERALEAARANANEEKAKLRLQKMQAFEKSFKQQDTVLVATACGGWRREVGGKERREKAMQRVCRNIANDQAYIQKECFVGWRMALEGLMAAMRKINGSAKDTKREVVSIMREHAMIVKQERVNGKATEQLERMRQQKLAVVEKSFNMSGWAAVKECLTSWFSVLDAARLRRRMKDGGMSASLKRIADANSAIIAEVFGEWQKGAKVWKQEREIELARRQKEMVERCRQRAIAALERNLNGQALQLLALCCNTWVEYNRDVKLKQKRKQAMIDRGMKMIAMGEEGLAREFFAILAKDTEVGKQERIGRVRQRRCAELGRGAYVRLRRHVSLIKVWEAWCTRAGIGSG